MSGYDGSIRINTNINTDGIAQGMSEIRRVIERSMSGSKPMQNTEQQVKQLGDSLSDTAKKASEFQNAMGEQGYAQNLTKEAREVQKEIDSLQKKLLSVYDSQERFLATGGKEDSSAYRKMIYDAETLESKLQKAEQAMEALVSSGKAFTIGADSDAEYWKQQEENIDRVIARMEERQRIEAETPPELLQPRIVEMDAGAFQEGQREAQALADTMASVGQNVQESAAKSNEAIASMAQELAELKARQKELESQGQGLGFEEYDANVQRIAEINDALSDYRRELTDTSSSYMNLKEVAQNTLKMMAKGLVDIPVAIVEAGVRGITSAVRELGNVVQKSAVVPFKLLGATAKKIFSSIGKSSKTSNNLLNKSFKNILKYGLGIRSVYMLINKLRTAVKEGFKNLAQVSTPVNESLSMLKSSLTQLKNSLATAFAPILTTITPLLTSFINMISKAATYVGMFTAALTGKGSFVKAVAVQEDYAASLEKTGGAAKKAVKALAGFDKLNVLGQTESDGGGAGAAETPVTDMFEEVEMPDKFKDMAQWIKDMWAEFDFTELGKYLGEKLKEALDSIPWDEIKEKAGNLGKSLATLINGFIEVDGLGYSIGRTLAEAFNTGFEFLNAFVHELHWDSLGKFIAETLNGIFENIDWELIHDTFVTGARGLGDAINSFADNLNWDAVATTVSNFVNTFVDTIYTFITTVDWSELGTKIGTAISDAWTGIDWAKAGETLGEYFKAFFDFVGKAIEAVDWRAVGESVKDFLVGIDWAGVADSFFEAVGAALGGFAAFIGGLIADGIEAAKEYFQDKIEEAGGNVVEGIFNGIIDALKNIGKWIYEHIFEPFIEGFKKAFEIHSPSKVMEEMGTYIIQGLLDGITSLVDKVTETWESMKENALEIWENVKETLSETWDGMKEKAAEIWDGMKENALETWENVKTGLSEKWDTIKKTATDVFEDMKESVSNIFDGMWTSIKNIINSILGGIETMANGVVKGINAVIKALNGLSFDIPDWISNIPGASGLAGNTFGFNIGEIPSVSIPRLADGAVIRGGDPFMAVLGDQRRGQTNIEAPLATIRQAVREELKLQGNSGRNAGGETYVFQVDGKTFFEVTRKEAQQYFKRTGMSPYPI